MSITSLLHSAPWFLPARIILALNYRVITQLRNLFYELGIFKTYSVKTPVISVGNISVGGSGKTILVQALVEHFLSLNQKPAVLSRGYGRSSKGLVLVCDGKTSKATYSEAGDEPFMIAQNFPEIAIVVSENRLVGAEYLHDNFSPDVIILDDGFQHRRLHRDLDILILDFQLSQKNHLLPWGYLRETLDGMNRANHIIYSKDGIQDGSQNNLVLTLENRVQDHQNRPFDLSELNGDYGLFAGLGKPEHFFNSVEEIHGPSSIKISFPDHAEYNQKQRDIISSHSCNYWITTQKDYIKLSPGFCEQNRVYFIQVKSSLPKVLEQHLKHSFN